VPNYFKNTEIEHNTLIQKYNDSRISTMTSIPLESKVLVLRADFKNYWIKYCIFKRMN